MQAVIKKNGQLWALVQGEKTLAVSASRTILQDVLNNARIHKLSIYDALKNLEKCNMFTVLDNYI